MYALTEALQPWYRDTAAGLIGQMLVAGAVCWFWDQCWGYPIQQRKQNGALKEPDFPENCARVERVFWFSIFSQQRGSTPKKLNSSV